MNKSDTTSQAPRKRTYRKRSTKTSATKARKKKNSLFLAKYPKLRMLLVLMLLLFTAFILSGGIAILFPKTWQGIGDFLPREPFQKPANQLTAPDRDMDLSDKLLRFVFIRRAINARIDRESYVTLEQISPHLREAIVAIEDNRFYNHLGFDIEAIMRATLVNIQYGKIEEGASTITQQLVKNLFLSTEATFDRKIEELLLALDIEATYSKDEILEMYLNTIYYGSGFYGINAASEGYFDLRPNSLDLPTSAMLAGIPNAPSKYSPFVDYMLAKKRQILVLEVMENKGYITAEEAADAKIKPLYLRPNGAIE